MTLYEALYGRPCRSLVCWMEVGERPSTGPDFIKDTSEKVDWKRKLKRFPNEPEVRQNQSTQRMKRHSSSTRGADGIGVEICRPYVVEARRGMLFEQTNEMP